MLGQHRIDTAIMSGDGHGGQEFVIVDDADPKRTTIVQVWNIRQRPVVEAATLPKSMAVPVNRQSRQEHHRDATPIDVYSRTTWLAQSEWTRGEWGVGCSGDPLEIRASYAGQEHCGPRIPTRAQDFYEVGFGRHREIAGDDL